MRTEGARPYFFVVCMAHTVRLMSLSMLPSMTKPLKCTNSAHVQNDTSALKEQSIPHSFSEL